MRTTDDYAKNKAPRRAFVRAEILILLIAMGIAAACRPAKREPTIAFPCEWPGSPGFGGNIDRMGIKDPSGVCFHPQRKTLFVVSDEGEIAEMKTDGTPIDRRPLPGDLEEVTVNPRTGILYIVVEGDDVILEYDPEKREVTRRFPVNREYQGDPNFLQKQTDRYDNGIESLAFVPDDKHPEGGAFYAGNQEDPPCIMELLVPLKSSKAATAEARILRVLPIKMRDPSAMYFDKKTGRLNVASDSDNLLLEITLDGRIIKEYAFPGDGQEGVDVDDEGNIYIAQDTTGSVLKLKDLRKR